MWTLILIIGLGGVTTGAVVLPGYSTREQCQLAGSEVGAFVERDRPGGEARWHCTKKT